MEHEGLAGKLLLMAVVVSSLLGCGSGVAQESGSLRERLKERMAQRQKDKKTEGDTRARITKPGDYRFTIQHDGLARSYLVHVPPGYVPGRPTPLLVSMHGGGGSMDYQASEENYGQISKSDREGFIVVFPNGISPVKSGLLATWNAGDCCGPARDKNIDDVGFLRTMIDNLTWQLDIDRGRIFATGMSNGGLMSYRLACEMPDLITAIAPVAGTDNTLSCNPRTPVSVLHIHARNDDHVPFEGGKGNTKRQEAVTSFVSVPETISRWVKHNACNPKPERVLEKPGVYCERYAPCKAGTEVQLCVTDNGAHSWPGAKKWRSSEPPSKAINANDLMWDFFMRR